MPGIPRFELPSSGLEWKAPVHPLKYFDATGRRAGVFGKQSGQYEAWIYPIKVLHGFRLEFRQEGMAEPVRGENYLEYLIARPESTTLVYVHPRFTVRHIIWTPLDEPAIVNFFDVDSDKPLAITAKFIPDFKPMWPASLGGQYSYWISEEKAFGFTDGTSKPTAVVGSPNVGAFTEHMDHAMVGGEMLLQLRIDPEQGRKTIAPIVMALSMESARKARETYNGVLARARELYETRVKYHKDFLARTLTIETPDAELNRAFTWAKVAIDAGWVCHEKMGCGLVAGYGPAGDYERPGFAWWFGGDALMASWAMLDYGDIPGAVQVLRFLKARQRADGKMMHEMTQSVDLVDWFGKYGFAYYHADTTPMYIYSVAEYWRRTGDKQFLEEFWPSVKKAYEYCLTTVDPNDGLMDNTKAGLAAVEVGPLRGKVTKDIYLQGFWLGSLKAMRELAYQMQEIPLAENASGNIKKAEATLKSKWWNRQGPYFAFGLTADGKRADMIGSWPAVLHSIYSFENGKGLEGDIETLARPELNTDWGIRWISNKDALYDPLSYNNGSVWPFMSGFAAWAFYNMSAPLNGYAMWTSNARLTGLSSPGALPELLTGDRFRSMERAVPHQLFSSVGVVTPAVRGLLDLSVERKGRSSMIMNGEDHSGEPELAFHPAIPADWHFIRFSRFAIGENHLSGEVRQQPGKMIMDLHYAAKEPIQVSCFPALPTAAKVRRILIKGKPTEFDEHRATGFTFVYFDFELYGHSHIEIEFDGGIGIVPPEPKPEPGDRTTSLKIIRVEHNAEKTPHEIKLSLAGLGGRTYTLDLVTTVAGLKAEGATVKKTENGYRLEIAFQGSDYVTRQIRLRW